MGNAAATSPLSLSLLTRLASAKWACNFPGGARDSGGEFTGQSATLYPRGRGSQKKRDGQGGEVRNKVGSTSSLERARRRQVGKYLQIKGWNYREKAGKGDIECTMGGRGSENERRREKRERNAMKGKER